MGWGEGGGRGIPILTWILLILQNADITPIQHKGGEGEFAQCSPLQGISPQIGLSHKHEGGDGHSHFD